MGTSTESVALRPPVEVTRGRRLLGYVMLLRPTTLARTPALVLLGAYLHEGRGALVSAEVWAFAAVATLLWAGHYVLNDVRDRETDAADPNKRARPLVTGTVSARTADTLGRVLVVASVVAAGLVSWRALAVLLAMVVGQYVYNRTKSGAGPTAIAIVGVVNPVLRLTMGWVAVAPFTPPPLLAALALASVHLVAVLLRARISLHCGHGAYLRPAERIGRVGLLVALPSLLGVGWACIILALVGRLVPGWPAWLGSAPLRFAVLIPPLVAYCIAVWRLAVDPGSAGDVTVRRHSRYLAIGCIVVGVIAMLVR